MADGVIELIEGLSPDFAGSMIETCYQPIVRMSDRVPIAVEALARLSHPSRGLLQPEQFVPQIEEAGRAFELTSAVVARMLADLRAACVGRDGLMLSVAVNVPLDVLLSAQGLEELTALRLAAGWEAGDLHIELTESRPVSDVEGLRAAVARARDGGYEVALDDYAPTMPHCAELLDLPFSAVKFDHVMIAAAGRDGPSATFVAATVAAAHARGMIVIAEGVEDAETWARLHAVGMDAAQGFWIAEPLPPAEIASWRERWVAAG